MFSLISCLYKGCVFHNKRRKCSSLLCFCSFTFCLIFLFTPSVCYLYNYPSFMCRCLVSCHMLSSLSREMVMEFSLAMWGSHCHYKRRRINCRIDSERTWAYLLIAPGHTSQLPPSGPFLEWLQWLNFMFESGCLGCCTF